MANSTEQLNKGPPLLLSARFRLALLTSLCCANIYQQRINLSVAIVGMVNHTALLQMENKEHIGTTELHPTLRQTNDADQLQNALTTKQKKEDGNLLWSKEQQGAVLSSLFWSMLSTRFLGGWLSDRYGTKQVLFACMLISTMATFVTPSAAQISPIAAGIVRIIAGIGQGGVYATLQSQWGRWAPPFERSLLAGISLAGSDIGVIAFYPADAYLCSTAGWPTVFYVSGTFGLVWCVLWQAFTSSSPAESRCIARTELRYIQRSLPHHNGNRIKRTPWAAILLSPAVWALACVFCAQSASYYFILTLLPTYMHEVLKFDIKQNGLFSALPYVGNMIGIYVTVFLADFVLQQQITTTTVVRKFCCTLALMVTGTALVAAGYCDCRTKFLAVGFMIAALTFAGVHTGAVVPTAIDIAPQLGGTITGICSTAGAICGPLMPVITAAMTTNHSASEWRSVFWLLFCVHVAVALIFLLFGDAKQQSWAVTGDDDSDVNTDKNNQFDQEDTTPLL